ncbi:MULTISPECIES: hypothetical protein [unclassified Bradyrhizobium]|uniref:hypothetical protein n=1 Tax=unclassified Bradyrhizobium TaxID=2631580 RepID=UPI0015CE9F06|nr:MULTISPECIES: hypothetical protein [unclassified Bradyrhizobium]MBB4259723.1 hypothetical protein [Bradyrhizobium sp. CIR3A]NYG47577.1 hypothetical protein [Bradyrhizobium sp. IAR9]
MASLNAALDAIERHLEFPRSRSVGVARRLQEAGQLPLGTPSSPPQVNEEHVLDLIAGLAADTTLGYAPEAVMNFNYLTPGGVPLVGAPDSIPTASIAVAVLIEDARAGVGQARKSQVEISHNSRALAIHKPDGSVARFCMPGSDATHWQKRGHHKSTTLNVAAIADAFEDIFGKVVA